jgi:hypothetical protein
MTLINHLHAIRMMPTKPDGSSTALVAGLPSKSVSRNLSTLLSHVPAHAWSGMDHDSLMEVARITRKGNQVPGSEPISIANAESEVAKQGAVLDRKPGVTLYGMGPSTDVALVHERSKYIVEQWTGQNYRDYTRVLVDAHRIAVSEQQAYRAAKRTNRELQPPNVHALVPPRPNHVGVPPAAAPPAAAPPAAAAAPPVAAPPAAAPPADAPPADAPPADAPPAAAGVPANPVDLVRELEAMRRRVEEWEQRRIAWERRSEWGRDDYDGRYVSGGHRRGRRRRARSESESPRRNLNDDWDEEYDRSSRRRGGRR